MRLFEQDGLSPHVLGLTASALHGEVKNAAERAPAARTMGRDTALFRRLVLGWIEADFRVQGRNF